MLETCLYAFEAFSPAPAVFELQAYLEVKEIVAFAKVLKALCCFLVQSRDSSVRQGDY